MGHGRIKERVAVALVSCALLDKSWRPSVRLEPEYVIKLRFQPASASEPQAVSRLVASSYINNCDWLTSLGCQGTCG